MIFISYAHEDKEKANTLYDQLKTDGYEPWLDTRDILPGSDWQDSISSAINQCDYFIALISNYSIEKRGYVQKELKIALDTLQQLPFGKVFLIPARLEHCEPRHPTLRQLQWVDFYPDWDSGYYKLNRVFSFIPKEIVDAPQLVDTHWVAYDNDDGQRWEFMLKANGIVELIMTNLRQDNGKWRYTLNKLYMEFNNKFVQYRAVFDNWKLIGSAQNIDGDQWTWKGNLKQNFD